MTARGSGRLWPLWTAGIVVLVSSGLALAHTAWNRSGEPRAVLELTERELRPNPIRSQEDTGLSLRLVWQALDIRMSEALGAETGGLPYRLLSTQPEWLDRERLAALGFDVSVPLDDPSAARHYRRVLARRVFVAYEMDGEAWRGYLAAVRRGYEECAERSEEPRGCPDAAEIEGQLQRIRLTESRLFAIDAAREAETLLDRYGGRPGVIALPARVAVVYLGGSDVREPQLRGTLLPPEVSQIHVPLPVKRALDPLLERPGPDYVAFTPASEDSGPRFRARVAWGRGFEPWVIEVESLPPAEPEVRPDVGPDAGPVNEAAADHETHEGEPAPTGPANGPGSDF